MQKNQNETIVKLSYSDSERPSHSHSNGLTDKNISQENFIVCTREYFINSLYLENLTTVLVKFGRINNIKL